MALFVWIFSLLGGVFLAIGLFQVVGAAAFKSKAESAEGVVVEIERRSDSDGSSYYPIVRFTPKNGEEIEFTGGIGSSPPSFKTGQKVKVLYDPRNPESARIDAFFEMYGFGGIFAFVGFVFLAIGLGMGIAQLRDKYSDDWLLINGKQVQAKIISVAPDTSFQVNGQSPFRITAQWENPNTRKVHVFRSDHIWFDPSQYIEGDEVTVLIDPKNPKKYDVDLRFLPELA
jgi:translation initiation factor IF-1